MYLLQKIKVFILTKIFLRFYHVELCALKINLNRSNKYTIFLFPFPLVIVTFAFRKMEENEVICKIINLYLEINLKLSILNDRFYF